MSVHVYRPQRTRPELLAEISVGRDHLLDDVLGRLGRWRPGASRQHYLFIGPRGIGKTHLLRLIEHQVRSDSGLRDKWVPILLAEEHYGISSVSDLLLAMLKRLGEESGLEDVVRIYESARFQDDDRRVRDLCLDALRGFHRENGSGVLLMVENLDRLLERQVRHRSELHGLRKILIEEDWLVVICTSPTFLNAVSQPEEPFFEFFDVRPLPELTPEEQAEMLRKLAAAEGNPEIMADVERYQSRLRALYHFTGGSPRLSVMLYDLVAHQEMGIVRSELDLLLDQLTPFYQDRMKEISEQEAKVLETMALLPEGTTPTELARETRLEGKTVRATLTRLERAGYVRREERRQKRTVYIVPERLFRIWHQMNHSRVARGRVQYLLEFFESWYATSADRDKVWDELTSAFERGISEGDAPLVEIAEYMDYVAAVSSGSERLRRSFDRLRALVPTLLPDAIDKELERLDRELGSEDGYLLWKGQFLADDLGRQEAAREVFEYAMEGRRGDLVIRFNHALALEIGKHSGSSEVDDAYLRTMALIAPEMDEEAAVYVQRVLNHVLRTSTELQMIEIAGHLLGRFERLNIGDFVETLRDAKHPWGRGAAAVLLGKTGSERALEPLVDALKDPESIVRARAAAALGQLGASATIEPLLENLEDSDAIVRGTVATVLARQHCGHLSRHQLTKVLRILVESSASLDMSGLVRKAISTIIIELLSSGSPVTTVFPMLATTFGSELRSTPFEVATAYLSSQRNPAVLERQQPEVREAVLLLTGPENADVVDDDA
jgi:DNA-binding transcriptional ArsR family regulator